MRSSRRIRAFTRGVAAAAAALIVVAAPAVSDAQSSRRDRERDRDRDREQRDDQRDQRGRRESSQEWEERCRGGWGNDDRARFCEVREQTIPARGGTITVDGGQNGGISVTGWDRGEVLVRAKIQAQGEDEDEARELARDIRIETGSVIRADGPPSRRRAGWSVSFEVMVPRRSDLSLETHNGGVSIEGVEGRIEFSAMNGGVRLAEVAGDVRGGTTNGGLHVELSGDRWNGSGLDVSTTNGGISLAIPRDYSARLETGTVNGGLNFDFPITIQGSLRNKITTTLGSGGPTVRVMTTNGGVRVTRR